MTELLDRYTYLVDKAKQLLDSHELLSQTILSAEQRLEKVKRDQELILKSLQAVKDVKPLLSAHSIGQCEKLCNAALKAIFETQAVVKFSEEEGAFVLVEPTGKESDLVKANGGGYQTVISFIFDVFLLMKLKKTKFLCFDEQLMAVSSESELPDVFPYENFIAFIRNLCKEIGLDILLITHDERLTDEMVDHHYFIEDGVTKQIK